MRRAAVEFVRANFYGPEPVVIAPTLFDPDSDSPILPPLRFAAQVRSWTPVGEMEGSWMNLVWFAEIDDDRSIKSFIEEALRQVNWEGQASGFEVQRRSDGADGRPLYEWKVVLQLESGYRRRPRDSTEQGDCREGCMHLGRDLAILMGRIHRSIR